MSEGKFTPESDFVDSFVNYFLLKETKLRHEARTFAECVNLNKTTTIMANCSDKRDKINKYFESNDEVRSSKDKLLRSCSAQILKAHFPFYLLNQSTNSITDQMFLKQSLDNNMNSLKKCLDE
jgi:hypothetical protein